MISSSFNACFFSRLLTRTLGLAVTLLVLTSQFVVTPTTLTAKTIPVRQSTASEQEDQVFRELEPGIRLLGNPSPTSVLGPVLKMALLPGNRLVVACQDGIKIWDTQRNAVIHSLPLDLQNSQCTALEISNDQNILAASFWSYANRSQTDRD